MLTTANLDSKKFPTRKTVHVSNIQWNYVFEMKRRVIKNSLNFYLNKKMEKIAKFLNYKCKFFL